MKPTTLLGGLTGALLTLAAGVSWLHDQADAPGACALPTTVTPPTAAGGTLLKVVSFNIQDTWVVGQHRKERMQAIGAWLKRLDVDLVGFQEAFIDGERQLLTDALAGSRLTHHRYFGSGVAGSGLLVSSAYPLEAACFRPFTGSNPWWKFWEADWWASKGVSLVRVQVPGLGNVDFYNTHAQADYDDVRYPEVRGGQLMELADFIHATHAAHTPAVVLGDVNCRQDAVELQPAMRAAGLVHQVTGGSGIDHVFTVADPTRTCDVVETRPLEDRLEVDGEMVDLSDHVGVLSVLRFGPTTVL